MKLPDGFLDLLRKPSPCFLTTLMPDGSPQTTETWVDTDGEHVIINTVQTHLKVRNIERDPRVAVAVCDASNPSQLLRDPRARREDHHRGRCRAHRDPLPALHGSAVCLVRRPGPGSCDPHHQRGQDSRHGSVTSPAPFDSEANAHDHVPRRFGPCGPGSAGSSLRQRRLATSNPGSEAPRADGPRVDVRSRCLRG